jgi:hypothetical protein
LGAQILSFLKIIDYLNCPQHFFGLSAFVFWGLINPESKGGVNMPLSFDYFERIIEAVESSERAYENGDMEEAAEYMGEVRHIAKEFLEELERGQEEGEDE